MTHLGVTPSQTVGPFFSGALLRDPLNVLAQEGAKGQWIRLEGRVLDGDGQPVPDAIVEIWQANAAGRYHHPADTRDIPIDPAFTGFGRSGTDDDGRYWFDTVKPGPIPPQAPHVNVTVAARGLLNHLNTRIYFELDEKDPILKLVPPSRRPTLLARAVSPDRYEFDVVLQGPPDRETVFFAFRR